jgi:hypothetical protein
MIEDTSFLGGTVMDARPETPTWPSRHIELRRDLLVLVLLLAGALGVYGHSLRLGFWQDDHNHLELCRANGFGDLAAGNSFDWNHRLVHVWWAAKETGWAYFRPLTVALRTFQLQCFGLSPLPYHIVYLGVFLLTLGLFFGLLRRYGLSRSTAAFAVLFFVLHPANVVVVSWLANDGPLLVGLWLVLGLWAMSASGDQGHRNPWWLAGVLLCYALAMASRENGVMVGPILVLLDFVRGYACPSGASKIRRATVCTLLFIECAIFLAVRTACLPPASLPHAPYFYWPWEPGFLSWLPFKVLNEIVCLPLGLPFVPIVDVSWWRARPVTALVAGLLSSSLLALVLADRNRRRTILAIVLGMALEQAPTTLSCSSPYHHYLATAGWAVLLALAVQRWWQSQRRWALAVPSVLGVVYLAGQWSGTWLLHSAVGTERDVRQAVLATNPRDYAPQSRLFFLNLPIFAAEVGPSLRLTTDRQDLQVYPLTFAPELFAPRTFVDLYQEDERTFQVRATGAPWFSGALGEQILLGWFGGKRQDLRQGPYQVFPAAGPMPFAVEILQSTETGVSSLRFTFDRPLTDPGNHFFLGAREGWAQPIEFRGPGQTPVLRDGDLPAPEIRLRNLRRVQSAYDRGMKVLLRWPL